MNQTVINGNNLDILKNYPDNYFDSIVTDPPYGLGKEPNAEELMKDWIEKGYHEIKGSGFMGKEWDAFVPQPIFWKEVYRVLKPGGHVLAFYGTRTYDWGVMAMRFAGFEVRDCIQWLYGSGFPKSHNISKALDKMEGAEREIGKLKFKGGTQLGVINDDSWKPKDVYQTYSVTEVAKQWDGWGTALKPANEPIVLARKPLEKGLSVAENILKWGVGGINIDASRVETTEDMSNLKAFGSMPQNKSDNKGFSRPWMNDKESILEKQNAALDKMKNLGRFPANIILTHHEDCECMGTKKVKPSNGSGKASEKGGGFSKDMFGDGTSDNIGGGFTDSDGNETVEDWDCHEDCPIRILDEQSGVSKSSNAKRTRNTLGSFGMPNNETPEYNDKGGASRFFYVAKASKAERNKGLEDFEAKIIEGRDEGQDERSVAFKARPTPMANIHPTVKPIKLMQYLVKMITPPNGIVLDPFCGSGTTGVACKIDGFSFVGLEQDPEYTKIAEARIENLKLGLKQLDIF